LHSRIICAHRFVYGGVTFEEQGFGFLVSLLRGQPFSEHTLRPGNDRMARLERPVNFLQRPGVVALLARCVTE
jgi:hypothetical protein